MSLPYCERYFNYCSLQKNLDFKTVKAYKIDLKQFEDFLSANGLQLSRSSIELYIEKLSTTQKPASVKRKFASLRAYLRFLSYADLLETNPIEKVKLHLRQEIMLPRTIEKCALEAIFTEAYQELNSCRTPKARFYALRNVAVLELLFASGVRVSELCHLTTDALNLKEKHMRIMGKGARERKIYISSPQVIELLTLYERQRSGLKVQCPYFFINRDGKRFSEQSVRFLIQRYEKAVGSDKHYTPHMFRHSFATYLWDNCGDIYAVKNILGHSSVRTTERYVHASYAHQIEVLTAAHPRMNLKIDGEAKV